MVVLCAICGTATKQIVQCLEKRQGKDGYTFLKTLYFQDEFFGGNGEEYCSAQCSTTGHLAALKALPALISA